MKKKIICIVCSILLLLLITISVFYIWVSEKVDYDAVGTMLEFAQKEPVASALQKHGIEPEDIAFIEQSLTVDDKNTLNKIIQNHKTEKGKILSYVKDNDMNGLIDYLHSSLSDEENEQAVTIYKKYESNYSFYKRYVKESDNGYE